jgi:DNA-directed RNA polymerase specialized sigma24 family protein
MMPATVPQTDFIPYLLQQTALRASLLQTSFGFAADDWDDLRQDLALDCLRRLSRFDAERGNWKGFVHGVVRNHACVLASKQVRRPELQCLAEDGDADGDFGEIVSRCDAHFLTVDDLCPALELSLDMRRVLDGLPEELRSVAQHLAEMPIYAVRQATGLSLAALNRKIARIRAAFVAAGLRPNRWPAKRGTQ